MKNKIRQSLLSMAVGRDREDAETKALELCRLGQEAFDILIDLGRESLKGNLKENRELLRAISFTLALFLTREKPVDPARQSPGIDLLIKFNALGFSSARNGLTQLGVTPKEIGLRHLMALPEVDRHRNDREISLNEALIEIELSQNLTGTKGPAKDRYCLGRDTKNRYDLFRTGKKRFTVRTGKIR